MVFALLLGFALDLACGDPAWLPHPVVAIGRLVAWLEKALRRIFPRTPRGETAAGGLLALVVVAAAFAATYGFVLAAGALHPSLATLAQAWFCYQALAARGLADAAGAVFERLSLGDVPGARTAVARIVGRDTRALDASAVARAAVESAAENSSDGVVAPMLAFAVGGAPLAMAYKAVNTMDSMLGYRNERYLHFGRAAARLDDAANFIPARLTAFLMIVAARWCGFDWRNAVRVWRRDRHRHASPNSGQPEAACAGALGVRLGGVAVYRGVAAAKPILGAEGRDCQAGDIRRACRLLYAVAFLCLALCCAGNAFLYL